MKLTAQQVLDRLNSANLSSFRGTIQFNFGGINVQVCQKDVVGNIMQEWLQKWFDNEDIEYALNKNSQMPPDFFLDPDNREHNMLEVKAFNYENTPGFDIAGFEMFVKEIRDHPYMLDVDYLIFGYSMDENGNVSIEEAWLKKVWQITRRGANYALFIQVKDDNIHKIRPTKWYGTARADFSPYESLEDFISAVEQAIQDNRSKLSSDVRVGTWRSEFINNYRAYYHKKLSIPRWVDIEDKYDLRIIRARKKATDERDAAQRNLDKITARISNWENKLAKAHTPSQKTQAEAAIRKAKDALIKASHKLEAKQTALDQLS